MKDVDNFWNIEGTVSAKEVVKSIVHLKYREVRCVCKKGGKAVPTSVFEATTLARNGVKSKRKNATLWQRIAGVQAKLEGARAAECTMRAKLDAAERQVITLKKSGARGQVIARKVD